MDLGFWGMAEPELIEELCNGCGLCVSGCDERGWDRINFGRKKVREDYTI